MIYHYVSDLEFLTSDTPNGELKLPCCILNTRIYFPSLVLFSWKPEGHVFFKEEEDVRKKICFKK
jgi:hypothetical protein